MSVIALRLMLTLDADTASQMLTCGEIYRADAGDGVSPLVTSVVAHVNVPARFCVDPGRYQYRFHADHGGGSFTLALRRVSDDTELASYDFDTAQGAEHRVFEFLVHA